MANVMGLRRGNNLCPTISMVVGAGVNAGILEQVVLHIEQGPLHLSLGRHPPLKRQKSEQTG